MIKPALSHNVSPQLPWPLQQLQPGVRHINASESQSPAAETSKGLLYITNAQRVNNQTQISVEMIEQLNRGTELAHLGHGKAMK